VRLGQNPKAPWLTVVGVVGDVRYREWEAARPDFYIPYTQRSQHRSDFVIKTHADPWALAAAVRREVFAADKNQPLSNVTTMEALVDRALAQSRFNGFILSALAGCAVLLAAIGIYGLLSYSVAQRRAEIGLRMALGATPGTIAKLVAGDAFMLVGAGAAAGVAGATMLHGALETQLYKVAGFDAAAYLGALLLLLLVTLIASVAPALRASWIDPSRALQSE